MNPFFFGNSKEPLYGVYYPAVNALKNEGVVLCNPFGQEGMRAHRALRQLAMLLAKKGYHVLRFDYRGTGDSALDMEEVSALDWKDDVGVAIDELRDMSGAGKIAVVGLRLGALIAAASCVEKKDINRLVLWDPVLSGIEYIDELRREMTPTDSGNFEDEAGCLHFNGFPLPKAFQTSLGGLSLVEMAPDSIAHIYQAVSHETEPFRHIENAWGRYKGFQCALTPAPHDWNFVDNFGGILFPQPIIQAIVDWMD